MIGFGEENMRDYNSRFHFNNVFREQEKRFGDIKLFQIGELYCQNNSVVPEHRQDVFEITYVTEGKGTCFTNHCKINLKKGDIHVSLANDRHSIESDAVEPLRYYFLAFELYLPHPFYKRLKQFEHDFASVKKRTCVDKFNLSEIFVRCLAEFANPNEFSELLVEGFLNQIIAYIFQDYNFEEYAYRPVINDKETLVYNLINYIEENLLSIRSMDDIFKNFNYSRSHLSHIFSAFMGISLYSYLTDRKLRKAAELLKNGHHTVTQISDILGYSSIHAFSRSFKLKYGVPPNSYIGIRPLHSR